MHRVNELFATCRARSAAVVEGDMRNHQRTRRNLCHLGRWETGRSDGGVRDDGRQKHGRPLRYRRVAETLASDQLGFPSEAGMIARSPETEIGIIVRKVETNNIHC